VKIKECVKSCTPAKNFTSFTSGCYETPNKTYIEFFHSSEWVSFTTKSSSNYMASITVSSTFTSLLIWEPNDIGFRCVVYSENSKTSPEEKVHLVSIHEQLLG
jgi:hypothetical protein